MIQCCIGVDGAENGSKVFAAVRSQNDTGAGHCYSIHFNVSNKTTRYQRVSKLLHSDDICIQPFLYADLEKANHCKRSSIECNVLLAHYAAATTHIACSTSLCGFLQFFIKYFNNLNTSHKIYLWENHLDVEEW